MRRLGLLLIACLLLLVAPSASAASPAGLTIQPLRQELALDPGQTVNSTLQVTNNTKQNQTVYMGSETFDVINENYDYSFSRAEGANKWISFKETDALIKPAGSHIFNYSLAVPDSAEPGGRYIAIFASVNQKSGDVDITNRAGQLSYITVNGDVTKQGQILSLDLPKFSVKNSLSWQTRLQNNGSAHFNSQITAVIYNIFGKKVGQTSQKHLILPNKIRQLSGQVQLGKWPGLYRIQFKVGRGDLPAQFQTKWVVYLPLWSIIILIVLITFVIEFFVKRRRRRSFSLRHRRIHN